MVSFSAGSAHAASQAAQHVAALQLGVEVHPLNPTWPADGLIQSGLNARIGAGYLQGAHLGSMLWFRRPEKHRARMRP